MAEVFLDTAYAIALSTPRDSFHEKAVALSRQLEKSATRLVTTQAVMLEVGNTFADLRNRQMSVQLLESFETDPSIEIVPLSQLLFDKAFHLYKNRPDKEWGLTDCMSFVVMTERNITDALTTDRHFSQAGFRVLLRDEGGNNG
jgi:uncharacterized protein